MVLNTEELMERLDSPSNLIKQLEKMDDQFFQSNQIIPSSSNRGSQPASRSDVPAIDDLIDGLDAKLQNANNYKKSSDVLGLALDQLQVTLPTCRNPVQLSKIASDASKIVNGIAAARSEQKTSRYGDVIIYKPVLSNENNYDCLQVGD